MANFAAVEFIDPADYNIDPQDCESDALGNHAANDCDFED